MSVAEPEKSTRAKSAARARMTGTQRRRQLLDIGRALFAQKGYDGTSIEEIASRAQVSKPVVYEHFGGKEGLYAVVVDREMSALLERITGALTASHPRIMVEQAAIALLAYVEDSTDGFRILIRDSPAAAAGATTGFSSLLNDAASQVEHILADQFHDRGFYPDSAPLYAQALVGLVATTAQWWLDVRSPSKEEVANHLVNLSWNGLANLDHTPSLYGMDAREKAGGDAHPAEGAGS